MSVHMSAPGLQTALASHKHTFGNGRAYGLRPCKRHGALGKISSLCSFNLRSAVSFCLITNCYGCYSCRSSLEQGCVLTCGIDAGRSAWSYTEQRPIQAMAGKDSDKSDWGRLISEALEFTQSKSPEESKQQPVASGSSAFPDDVKAGQLLAGKYRVVEVLGRGKAGVMYKVSIAYTVCTMVPGRLSKVVLDAFDVFSVVAACHSPIAGYLKGHSVWTVHSGSVGKERKGKFMLLSVILRVFLQYAVC